MFNLIFKHFQRKNIYVDELTTNFKVYNVMTRPSSTLKILSNLSRTIISNPVKSQPSGLNASATGPRFQSSNIISTRGSKLPFSSITASTPVSKFQFSFFQRYFSTSNNISLLNPFTEKKVVDPKDKPLKNTALVYIHHALNSSILVLKALIQLGLDPKNIFILDKHYSRCEEVVKEIKELGVYYQSGSSQVGLGKFSQHFNQDISFLWYHILNNLQSNVTDLIIMDHGGHALGSVPASLLERLNVVGAEKTTAGLIHTRGLIYPVIEMASSATKKYLESPLIAEAVVSKLTSLTPIKDQNLTCGVVGYGTIGKAIADKLLALGHNVIIYDHDPSQLLNKSKKAIATKDLTALLAYSDYIFGCTGRDITANADAFDVCPRKKTLISCSSEDVEFLSLLLKIQAKQNGKVATKPLNDVVYHTKMGEEIKILRGGFPVNFDHSGESVPFRDILLTRLLVVASALQAIELKKNKIVMSCGGNYMLDPKLQQIAIDYWLKLQPTRRVTDEKLRNFTDVNWIKEHSGGMPQPIEFLQDTNSRSFGNNR